MEFFQVYKDLKLWYLKVLAVPDLQVDLVVLLVLWVQWAQQVLSLLSLQQGQLVQAIRSLLEVLSPQDFLRAQMVLWVLVVQWDLKVLVHLLILVFLVYQTRPSHLQDLVDQLVRQDQLPQGCQQDQAVLSPRVNQDFLPLLLGLFHPVVLADLRDQRAQRVLLAQLVLVLLILQQVLQVHFLPWVHLDQVCLALPSHQLVQIVQFLLQ